MISHVSPTTLDEALRFRRSNPQATVLAGGTDLMVAINAGQLKPRVILNLWNVRELTGIIEEDGRVTVGAMASYTDLVRSPIIARACSFLVDSAKTIGAVQIQNRGTLAGNVVNASPAADSVPVLSVLEAEVLLASESERRSVPINDFYVGYRKTVLRADELVVGIRFALPEPAEKLVYRKVGTRQAQAISKVVMAARLKISPDARVDRVAVAFGSLAPTVVRLRQAERFLQGEKLGAQQIDRAVELLQSDIAPIDDIRSTAAYRRQVAANLLREFLTRAVGRLAGKL